MSEPTIEERVSRGAAWLDEVLPGWERQIDLGQLSTESTTGDCPLCQVTHLSSFGHAFAWAVAHGMTLAINDAFAGKPAEGWQALDNAWASLIKERFASGLLSDEVDA